MKMAKVSIIIPIYNVAGYVRRTIESAQVQTESDIEIILVDDGSTDCSGDICDEIALLDERVSVIHKQNGGLSSARNAGAQNATSDYVLFLDGDDYLREDAVECCLKTMQAYPCDFVQYLYQEVEEGQQPVRRESDGEIYQATTCKELFENLYRLGGVAASGATKFMHRRLALEIPFENIRHEDEMWCTQAFQRDLTVTYLPEELYYYVMRNGSIIRTGFNRKKLDIFTIIIQRIQVLDELKLSSCLSREYSRLFYSIVRFYTEAKNSNDEEASKEILEIFKEHKGTIEKNANLHGKFLLLLNAMKLNVSFIEFYRMYWNYTHR